MIKYCQHFQGGMNNIFARCDALQGKLYQTVLPILDDNPELQKFVEMCFDPDSPMNERLKNTLIRTLEGSIQT